ncbi:MAG: pyridoxamine kinase [Clostridia bacterium]|nr:pyridoxamine kinase [Clostridia bacterium]
MNETLSNRESPAPSVIAVHDLACLGRCALTIVIPTLAAMGVQPLPLPTAILSAHTGFSGVAARHLDGFMADCLAHWQKQGLAADAVYSGYLANPAQVALVEEVIAWQRASHAALVVADPAMADNGRMYSGLSPDMPAAMKRLCDQADVITPNLTEAALMLNRPYTDGPMTDEALWALLHGFSAGHVVITSAVMADGAHANLCHARGEAGFWVCPYQRVGAAFHGTGDLFTSVLTGALLRGAEMKDAVAQAGDFVRRVIETSVACGVEERDGVQLEIALRHLLTSEASVCAPRFVPMPR